ncbi:MAG: threonine synthase [Clostridia bacterium]|nr:threonine synthase [Clostridia bacterium]
MKYVSTRGGESVSPSLAILRGIAPNGGLYVPESIPSLSSEEFQALFPLSYAERAAKILGIFLTDFTQEELLSYTTAAYSAEKFPGGAAPLVKVEEDTYILELFHGPTCAFKDMALQILPYLMTASAKKNNETENICILVATSGDTGKAALEGFADVPGTSIFVYYPADGVSTAQKLQMITQKGQNVGVSAVYGNFDDAQTGVKKIFADADFAALLKENHVRLSSANSINWGRLVPQVVYYISAYLDAVKEGWITYGEGVDVAVPTGNFGNILACLIAKKMGLPVDRLICASNKNNVLSDFIETGVYNKNREFHTTSSPSMDILISSNVERLLWFLAGGNSADTADKMQKLNSAGIYELNGGMLAALQADFEGGWASEEAGYEIIRRYFVENGYLSDTHTAVALSLLDAKRQKEGKRKKTIVASTASPFKFASSVLYALDGVERESTPGLIDELAAKTGVEAPAPLVGLDKREIRFAGTVEKDAMRPPVLQMLGIEQ